MSNLIVVAALAFAAPSSEPRICEAQLMGPEPTLAFARLEVDPDDAVVDTYLFFSARGFKLNWRIKGGSFDASSSLANINLPGITLPPDIAFPVTVYFLIDGKEMASRSFAGPTEQVVYASEVKPPPWAGPPRPGQFFPGVDLEVEPAALPNIFRATRAELVVTAGRAGRLGAMELPLPDWDKLAAAARLAFIDLEARRMRRGCEERPRIVVTSGH
jgi:hypothetical protein